MTGLKAHLRDPRLPAQAGDAELCVPSDPEIAGLIGEHLCSPGSARVAGVHLTYARWKPQRSITCTYDVELDDLSSEIVVYKRYLDDKARHVARHFRASSHTHSIPSQLRPVGIDEERGICLFRFPADRVLRGAARVLNRRRLARRVDGSGHFEPFVVRLRPSSATLLRFKPERRAVFRFDAKLRGPAESRRVEMLGVRVLPPHVAQEVTHNRRALNAMPGLCPRLLDADLESGVLLEEWLNGSVNLDDDFGTARDAGISLAAFHSRAGVPRGRAPRKHTHEDLAPLFRVDENLTGLWSRSVEYDPPHPTHWIHGDFHPDQLIHREGARPALLDLDAVRAGSPVEDLSSWVADHIAAHPHVGFDFALEQLIAGYALIAPPPPRAELARWTSIQLANRAGAAIRRLERDAIQKATRLLEKALQLQGGHSND